MTVTFCRLYIDHFTETPSSATHAYHYNFVVLNGGVDCLQIERYEFIDTENFYSSVIDGVKLYSYCVSKLV